MAIDSVNIKDLVGKEIKVLDKGFIRLIDYMGDDSSIAQAARVSYGKGTKTLNNDVGLIRYLLKHKHTTPFEMCEIKFHIKAPIFVARQWLRHRTANINEYSARYSIMENDYYVPDIEQVKKQSSSNKQGRGESLDKESALDVINKIEDISKKSFKVYNDLLDDSTSTTKLQNTADSDLKIAKELARIVLPVNVYTQFYWKIDLHNLLHFLHLRADSHAQYEIRIYAIKILDIIKQWVPITYQAFMDYILNTKTFSAPEINIIKELLLGKKLVDISHNLSKRELTEFKLALDIKD